MLENNHKKCTNVIEAAKAYDKAIELYFDNKLTKNFN